MAKYRKTPEQILKHRVRLIKKAGLKLVSKQAEAEPIEPLDKRIKALFDITQSNKIPIENMLWL